jgi:hypothetical protein
VVPRPVLQQGVSRPCKVSDSARCAHVIPLGKPPFHSERKTAAQCEEAPSYSMQDPAEPVMEVVLFARQDAVEARGNAYADYAPAR